MQDQIKQFYRRNLPHIQPIGASFFVTFRLKDSIPKDALVKLETEYKEAAQMKKSIKNKAERNSSISKLRKQYFAHYDKLLDKIETCPHHLANNQIARIVVDQLQRFDRDFYNLIAYCIMSSHNSCRVTRRSYFNRYFYSIAYRNRGIRQLELYQPGRCDEENQRTFGGIC